MKFSMLGEDHGSDFISTHGNWTATWSRPRDLQNAAEMVDQCDPTIISSTQYLLGFFASAQEVHH